MSSLETCTNPGDGYVFFHQGAPRFLKVLEIVLEGSQDVSGSLKSLLRSLKKIRTGEQVSLGNEMCLSV